VYPLIIIAITIRKKVAIKYQGETAIAKYTVPNASPIPHNAKNNTQLTNKKSLIISIPSSLVG